MKKIMTLSLLLASSLVYAGDEDLREQEQVVLALEISLLSQNIEVLEQEKQLLFQRLADLIENSPGLLHQEKAAIHNRINTIQDQIENLRIKLFEKNDSQSYKSQNPNVELITIGEPEFFDSSDTPEDAIAILNDVSLNTGYPSNTSIPKPNFTGLLLTRDQQTAIANYMQTTQRRIAFLDPIITLAYIKNTTVENIVGHYLKKAPSNTLQTNLTTTRKIIQAYCETYPQVNSLTSIKGQVEQQLNNLYTTTPEDQTLAAVLAESAQLAEQEAAERKRKESEYQAAAEQLIIQTSPTNDTRAGNLTAMQRQERGATGSSTTSSSASNMRPVPAPRKSTSTGQASGTTTKLSSLRNTPATYVFDNSQVQLNAQKLALAQQYIQSLTQDEFKRLQNFVTSQSVSLEKILALYLLAQRGPITVFSARTVDSIEGTPVDNIITAYNKLQSMKKKMSPPVPTVSSSGTVATQSLTPPAQKQKPVPAPRPRPILLATTAPAQSTPPALATPIAAQQVVASADHTMFGILTEHKTNNMQSVTVSTPRTHTFNWQFKPYLKSLAVVTVDQKAVITNYIQSLSNDDYTYLVSLAHIKKTTPEYILAAYMQANADNLTLYVPVLTVSTWYLDNYPTPLQTTAASLALEKQLHASTQSGVTATIASWWKWATGQ